MCVNSILCAHKLLLLLLLLSPILAFNRPIVIIIICVSLLQGRVAIMFSTLTEAIAAATALAGRMFAGKSEYCMCPRV